MGESIENEAETRFTGDDSQLQGVIGRIVGAGERVNGVFDRASHLLGSFASIGAVVGAGFSLERAVESTTEYMRSIDRISTLTNLSTQRTDGMLEAMEKVGIEAETSERILLGMSRRTANLEMHMNAMGQATGNTASMLRRMGVDINKGPVDALESMAKQVQAGQLGVAQLGVAFGVPRTQTIALYKMLQRGPEYIRDNIREAERFGVTISDLSAYRRMKEAQYEISAAWKRINLIVGAELMPLISDLLRAGAERLKGWVERAREFGGVMRSFLEKHYELVVKIGKVMLANYALQKVTGMGIVGNVTTRVGQFSQAAFHENLFAKAGGNLAENAGTLAKIGAGLRTFLAVSGRISVIGAAVLFIVSAFEMIRNDTKGIRTYFVDLWDRVMTRFQAFSDMFSRIFDPGGSSVFGKFFSNVRDVLENYVIGVLKVLPEWADHVLGAVHLTINLVKTLINNPRAVFDPKQLYAEAAMRTEMQMANARAERMRRRDLDLMDNRYKREVPKERERAPVFDFRGSRFDIRQQFAEVDPDRIALAFANSLGAMGERRVQSSFAPLWSI